MSQAVKKPTTKAPVKPKNPVVNNKKTLEEPAVSESVVSNTSTTTTNTSTTAITSTTTPNTTTSSVQPAAEVKSEAAQEKTPRAKSTEIVSASRTRRILSSENLNQCIEVKLGPIKCEINRFKKASNELNTKKTKDANIVEVDGKKKSVQVERDLTPEEIKTNEEIVATIKPKLALLEQEKVALSRERIRLSDVTSHIISTVLEEMTTQLVTFAMDEALKDGKKMIKQEHVHRPGVEKLTTYPLFMTLDSWKTNEERISAENRKKENADAVNAAVADARKKFKEEFNVKNTRQKKQPAANPEPEVENHEEKVADDSDDNEPGLGFGHYVTQVCKHIKCEEKYRATRISDPLKTYLSDLLVEFVVRLSNLIRVTTKNKTITDVAVKRTLQTILIDGHRIEETVELVDAMIRDPEVVKREAANKALAKKEGREYKIKVADIPLVPGKIAVRRVSYPTSGYAEIEKLIDAKVAEYKPVKTDDETSESEEEK